MLFKCNLNLFLALTVLIHTAVEARDIVWDTSPKVHTFIVKNFDDIKRQIYSKDYSLLEEIQAQLLCPSKSLNIDVIHIINNESITPAIFAMKIVNALSC